MFNGLKDLYSKLKNNIMNWYITASDVCTAFGLDAQPFSKNEYYSKKISNYFENNVEVVCYTIRSKHPYIYGYPGHKIMSNPYILKIKHLPDFIIPGVLTIIDICLSYIGMIEKVARGILIINKQNELYYNPITKKFRIPVDYHCIYITDRALELLTEDEIIAMCIYVCGSSQYLFYESIVDVLKSIDKHTFFFFYGYLGLTARDIYNKKSTIEDSLSSIIYWLSALGLSTIVLKTIVNYYRRVLHMANDEFPIKCNFGKPYLSARKKFNKYLYEALLSKESTIMNNNSNILDKMVRLYYGISLRLHDLLAKYGLTGGYDKDMREQMIADKIIQYQPTIDNNIVNRSANINLTQTSSKNPFLNVMDSIHNTIINRG